MGIEPEEVWSELSSRSSKSGFEEKKNRGKEWKNHMTKTIFLPKY